MTPLTVPTKTISTRQIAEQLGVQPRTIRRLVRAGRLPAYRLGRVLRFAPDAIHALKEDLTTPRPAGQAPR